MKDNKLIAEFMEHEPIVKGDDVYYELNHIRLTSEDDLRYHTSWDWLMPVVQKCLDVSDDDNIEDFYSIQNVVPNIEATYDAVVGFIKQYNDEKLRSIPSA